MVCNTLQDLYLDILNDVYTSEKRTHDHLTATISAASEAALKDEFSKMYKESEVARAFLDEVFKNQHLRPVGKKNTIINALIQKSIEQIEYCNDAAVKDCALIVSLQCIIHYQVASYGSVAAFAKTLGLDDVAESVHTIIGEKKAADVVLSQIAAKGGQGVAVNTKAA